MREIETDYLVVGAGASGMGFVDSLLTHSDADAVIIDRRHRPGGHWLDAYPFVRIHQTSANYGVPSRVLGNDRIDDSGPNAGFYERSTAGEICDYYNRVLEETFLGSGRVRFFGMSDYRGEDADGHHFVSLITGERATVKVRRKLVDATYVQSEIPSKHTPHFDIDPGVRFVTPNQLVDLGDAPAGFTVLGAGKTAMDTCYWLLEQGVAPDAIRWVCPRDGWVFDRASMQPLENVGAYMKMTASWVAAAAEAKDGSDITRGLEASGVMTRIDPDVEPEVFRGAILSETEVASLRRIDDVIRLGKVLRIGTNRTVLEAGEIATDGHVFVDCTAAGFHPPEPKPIFEPGRITVQVVTLGILPWSSATVGVVEALRDDDDEKNRLCPPLAFSGRAADMHIAAYAGMTGMAARGAEPDINAWNEACRLNPGRGAMEHLDDPRVPEAFASLGANIGPAMENLARIVGVASPV